MATLDTPDGPMDAIVARPDAPPTAGVVVVQEAFGLTPHIGRVCDRLARHGLLAVAPAFFHRTGSPVLGYGDYASVIPHLVTLTPEGLRNDVAAALGVLDQAGIAPKGRGIIGFCMGGTVALWAGTAFDLGAAVTYYGSGIVDGRFGLPPLLELAPTLRCPWLGNYGDLDEGISVEQVEALRGAAAQATIETEIRRYADAGHGFNCDDRDAYREVSAQDAWEHTLTFFDRHLLVQAQAHGRAQAQQRPAAPQQDSRQQQTQQQ